MAQNARIRAPIGALMASQRKPKRFVVFQQGLQRLAEVARTITLSEFTPDIFNTIWLRVKGHAEARTFSLSQPTAGSGGLHGCTTSVL
jgi:hypothetical protein